MHRRTLLTALIALVALLPIISVNTAAQAPEPVWTGEYYNNSERTPPVVFTRTDSSIAFDWGFGSPGNGLSDNEFSIRWTTAAYFAGGTYRFWALADDNIRITLDGNNTIIDTFATNEVDELITRDVTLSAGVHSIEIIYRELVAQAFAYVDYENVAFAGDGPDFGAPVNPTPDGAWTANYYANPNLNGAPIVTRGEMQPGGNWGLDAPLPALPANQWSARWTTTLNLAGGDYRIRARADDGLRVYLDGALVIDEWHIATGETYTATRNLFSGNHGVTVEFYESAGLAFLEFSFDRLDAPQSAYLATVTTGLLNVRDAPNPITGNILTQISNNEVVPALARTSDRSWVQVNANGVVGWVNATYISLPNLSALPVEDATQPTVGTGYIVTATPFPVNIRTGPGTQFRDIGNLPEDDTAQVIGRNANATWWQIDYNGIVGWVSAQYARIEAGADLAQIPIRE